MLKIKKLQKQRTAKQAELKKLRARRKQLRADEVELEQQIEEAEEISPKLEQQIDELSSQLEEVNDAIADAQDAIETLDAEISAMEEDVVDVVDEALEEAEDPDEDGERARKPSGRRSAQPRRRSAVSAGRFNCRSRCFDTRAERDAFYARGEVKAFVQRVRDLAASERRAVKGVELTIPEVVLELLRDNMHKYSKLISHVRLRTVKGNARQPIIGDVPEAIWMEMTGILNDLEFNISELEVDGFKLGGFMVADNSTLADSDIALGEEIVYMLGQSTGLGYDKGTIYGKGPTSKMPVGIVTRLAETSQPSYWGANRPAWTDLHSSHVCKLNIGSYTGENFFVPFLQALAKAEPKFSSDGLVWVMNDKTRKDILIRSLGFNSAAAIVAGMDNTMPILGGVIETEEFMPDYEVVGGYFGEYLSAEREGATFARSDIPLFIQDKTVFKGTARYDGQPIRGEAFVVVNYSNSDPTTEMSFATDYANTPLNALICTAAAGSATGDTVVTVTGMKDSSGGKLYALVSGAPVSVVSGGKIRKADWTALTSGTTQITAAAGVGITVVELDGADRIVSVGYVASVPKAAG